MQMLLIDHLLLGISILLLLSIAASKASGRLGVPALLLFLLIGMLAGSEGPGGIYFADPWLAQCLGITALIFILFDGGLQTKWKDIRPILWRGFALSTLGVMITAAIVGVLAFYLLDLPILEAMLLGAIVSATDAAAVFMVLRSSNVRLKGNLQPLLELESGSNDPMAIFLTISLITYISGEMTSVTGIIPSFAQEMALGAVIGYLSGKAISRIINRIKLECEGLYPVLTISMMLLTYGLTCLLEGNGFLAVYLAGITLGNTEFIHKRMLRRIHDSAAWLMQIVMFLALGLLVFPNRLIPIASNGLLISLVLMFLARPVSVFVCMIGSGLSFKEKVLVSWVGLKGAAPIILATFPLIAGLFQADRIFNFVFFIVLTSALVQGSTISSLARWLGLDAPQRNESEFKIHCPAGVGFIEKIIELPVFDGAPAIGKRIIDLGLSQDIVVAMIKRGDDFIIPSGSTILEKGDILFALSESDDPEHLSSLRSWFADTQEEKAS